MLKYILVTLTFLFTGSLFAQDSTPVFVTSNYVDWFHKEVKKLNSSVNTLESSKSYDSYTVYGKIKGSLRRFDANINEIYKQMAVHMDEERNDILRKDYVDGKGMKYDVEMERMRNSDLYREFQMTPSQMLDFKNQITEVSQIRERLLADDNTDKAATVAYLKKACLLVDSTESLLDNNSISNN